MEYVDGDSLDAVVARRRAPFSIDQTLKWTRQVCAALDHAHQQGVLHRDVKPGNILIETDGAARLADFGIAQLLHKQREKGTRHSTEGTLMYMSPEQLAGRPTDVRSDLYSVASTVYELLSGAPPFHQGSIIPQVQLKPAEPIDGLAPALNAVLLKALAKEPGRRHGSCGAFYSALCQAAVQTGTTPQQGYSVEREVSADDAWRRSSPEAETIVLPAAHSPPQHARLGHILLEQGVITQEQLDRALADHARTGSKLGTILVALGYADEESIVRTVASQLRIPVVALDSEPIQPHAATLLARDCAVRCGCLPVRCMADRVFVAMANPLDLSALNEVETACGRPVEPGIATESALQRAIERMYPD